MVGSLNTEPNQRPVVLSDEDCSWNQPSAEERYGQTEEEYSADWHAKQDAQDQEVDPFTEMDVVVEYLGYGEDWAEALDNLHRQLNRDDAINGFIVG